MHLFNTIEVAAPADAAWNVLGEQFGNVAEWSSTLSRSVLQGQLGVGAVRACTNTGFGPFPAGEVVERLTHFDRASRSYTYTATVGLPPFIRSASNAWSVHAHGPDRCTIHTHATLQLAWWARPFGWLLPWAMRRDFNRFTEELRYRVEHGSAHPRKTVSITG